MYGLLFFLALILKLIYGRLYFSAKLTKNHLFILLKPELWPTNKLEQFFVRLLFFFPSLCWPFPVKAKGSCFSASCTRYYLCFIGCLSLLLKRLLSFIRFQYSQKALECSSKFKYFKQVL